jgi:hypothetical protein
MYVVLHSDTQQDAYNKNNCSTLYLGDQTFVRILPSWRLCPISGPLQAVSMNHKISIGGSHYSNEGTRLGRYSTTLHAYVWYVVLKAVNVLSMILWVYRRVVCYKPAWCTMIVPFKPFKPVHKMARTFEGPFDDQEHFDTILKIPSTAQGTFLRKVPHLVYDHSLVWMTFITPS